jgi:shikimate kinase
MEAQAVQEAAMRVNVVIATGGGAVLDARNVEVLSRTGVLIWLRVAPAEIVTRCGTMASRPLLAAARDAVGHVKAMLAQREPLYGAAADAVVETTGLRRQEAATLVLGTYRRLAAAWPTVPGRDRQA